MSAGAARRPQFAQALQAQTERRLATHRQRQLQTQRWLDDGRIESEAGPVYDFCSNDYLGLARDPQQAQVLASAAQQYGSGAGSAHAVCGHHLQHQRLEADLADWLGRPRTVLFSSGWSAALGTLDALLGRHDLCTQDRLNHACLLDGARLAGSTLKRYPHADAAAARAILQEHRGRRAMLVTDGVFSMDGDTAPLAELAAVSADEQAWLMVDEAHALGVIGEQGAGSANAAGLSVDQAPVLMGTFGKALGGFGAFVAGSELLIDTLINQARPHLFTTALPPAWASCMRAAVERVRSSAALRDALAHRIERFRARSAGLGLPLMDSASAIQPLILGAEERALHWEKRLLEDGFAVKAIRPPTVPEGRSRLRITLNVRQPMSAIERLLETLARVLDSDPNAGADRQNAS